MVQPFGQKHGALPNPTQFPLQTHKNLSKDDYCESMTNVEGDLHPSLPHSCIVYVEICMSVAL